MCEFIKKISASNIFPILCYLLAIYFGLAFNNAIGFPPSKPLDADSSSYLALFLFFFILPDAKKLKLGSFLEYEAKVKEIKADVKEFKEETRSTINAYTTLISAITNNMSQTVNVTLPGTADAEIANEALDTTLDVKIEESKLEEEIKHFLVSEDNDLNYALAKLRMRIEKELRRILGKSSEFQYPIDDSTKFLSTRSLFRQFTDTHIKYKNMTGSYDYILKICNAAIHGQFIPQGYAHEALYMGFKVLTELQSIQK